MATIARGVAKIVSYKRETTWGTLAGAPGGKQLRRVTAAFNLTKETYESSEIRTDRQLADFRHGVRSAEGSLNGELSSASYADFMQSLVAKDFAAKASVASLSITVAAAGAAYTVTRAAGSWITDAVAVGMVIRLTGAMNAANTGKNLLVTKVTALALTVVTLDGSNMVPEGPIATVSAAFPGKNTLIPATAHTDDSYSIEQWFSDIAQSEVYTGMKVGSMNVQLPASGLATVDFSFMGKDLGSKGVTQYFTAPTAQGTDGIYAAVNGRVLFNGAPVAVITSADFSIERAQESAQVVGSNAVAEIFTGRIRGTGNLSVYFTDTAFRDAFDNETPVSLVFSFTEGSAAAANFISFTFPKVKLGSFSTEDSELGLTASCSFTALLNDVTSAGLPATTFAVQDSAVV